MRPKWDTHGSSTCSLRGEARGSRRHHHRRIKIRIRLSSWSPRPSRHDVDSDIAVDGDFSSSQHGLSIRSVQISARNICSVASNTPPQKKRERKIHQINKSYFWPETPTKHVENVTGERKWCAEITCAVGPLSTEEQEQTYEEVPPRKSLEVTSSNNN